MELKSNVGLKVKGAVHTVQYGWVINQERSEEKLSKQTVQDDQCRWQTQLQETRGCLNPEALVFSTTPKDQGTQRE